MYHYILTLFTNVCFSRNNGTRNPNSIDILNAIRIFRPSLISIHFNVSLADNLCINLNKRYILIILCDEVSLVFKKNTGVQRCYSPHAHVLTSCSLLLSLFLGRVILKKLFVFKLFCKSSSYARYSCILFIIRTNIRYFAHVNG